jgi:hypothetical protein
MFQLILLPAWASLCNAIEWFSPSVARQKYCANLSSFVFFFSFFFLSLPTHCGGRGLLFRLITLNDTRGRSPLDEWSARRRDLYLKTHDTHNRQTPMPPVEFQPSISASERPQTHALDGAAAWIGHLSSRVKYTYPFVYRGFCRLHGMRLNVKFYKVHCFLHTTDTSSISVENLTENTTVAVVKLQRLLTRVFFREGNSAFRLKCDNLCRDVLSYTSQTLKNALKSRLHWICTIQRFHVI